MSGKFYLTSPVGAQSSSCKHQANVIASGNPCRYLVLLLNTVVDLYGKPGPPGEVEEDYNVVKSRLDECCRLQPRNPVPYKLRGDWCGRFPAQYDRWAFNQSACYVKLN